MNVCVNLALYEKHYSAAERLYQDYTDNPDKYSEAEARDVLVKIENLYGEAKVIAEENQCSYNALLVDMKRGEIAALSGDALKARELFNHIIRDAGRLEEEGIHLVLESYLSLIYTLDSEMDWKTIRRKCNIALRIGVEYLSRSVTKHHRIIYAHAEIEKYLGLMEEEEDHRKKMHQHYSRSYELYMLLITKMPEMYTMGFASVVERLSIYYVHKGKNYVQAIALYEQLQRLGEAFIYRFKEDKNTIIRCLTITADGFHELGEVYNRLGKVKKSPRLFEQSARIYNLLANYSPKHREKVAHMQSSMGYAYLEGAKNKKAYDAFEQAAEAYRRFEGKDSEKFDYEKAADLHIHLGQYYIKKNNFHKSIRTFEHICCFGKKAMETYPGEPKPKAVYATGISHIASVYGLLKKHKEQKKYLAKAFEVRKSLVAADPDNMDLRNDLAETLQNMGDYYMIRRRYNKALNHYKTILEDRQRLSEEDPIRHGAALLNVYSSIASLYNNRLLFAFKKRQYALIYYNMALSLANKLYDSLPQKYQQPLADISGKLGRYYYKTKEYGKAREHLSSSSSLYRSFDKSVDRSTWSEMMELLSLQADFECKVNKDLDVASEILDYLTNSFDKAPEYWKSDVKGLRYKIDVLTSSIEKLRINI